MLTLLEDLVIDRVDLVDEGANSAAFIELFKRKELSMEFSEILSKMKPEHATVIEEEITKAKEDRDATISEQATKLEEANEALAKANEELEILKAKMPCECDGEADENGVCKACGKPKKKAQCEYQDGEGECEHYNDENETCKGCGRMKKGTGFDETEVLKSMPEAARELFMKERAKREVAEEQIRKAAEEKAEAEAVAKAAELKSLPVEQETLVGIVKNCDETLLNVLKAAAAAIDGVVLEETGTATTTHVDKAAWDKIEAEAEEVAKRDEISKEKAISVVIKEKPELYREYLNGGAE